jgi:hypothetical protein
MSNDRMARWLGPLALVYVVALALAFFIIGANDNPGQNAPAAEVVRYYQTHGTRAWAQLAIIGVGLAAMAFFFSGLRDALRATNESHSWLSTAAFAGGLIYIAGFAMTGMNLVVLIEAAHNNRPEIAAQANFVDQQVPIMIALGLFVMTLAIGVLILAGSTVPRWLGVVFAVIAVATLSGIGAFPAFLATPIFLTVLGFMLGYGAEHHAATDTAKPRRAHRLIPHHR